MSEALVSVTVPVYNGARFLKQALDSVFAQSYRPLDVIVVDDGSTDESGAIARSYPEVRYVRQANAGVSAARNRGIAASIGGLVAFLDADDRWMPEKTAKQVTALAAHPEYGFVLCQHRMWLQAGDQRPAWASAATFGQAQPSFVPSAWLVSRETFRRVGPFRTDYANGQDMEWLARAKDLGILHGRVEEALLEYRIHQGNASGDTRNALNDRMRLLRESVHRQARTEHNGRNGRS